MESDGNRAGCALLSRKTRTSLCALALLLGVGLAGCAPPEPLSLVVVSLDTTRADHLGVYGYDRPTSPALDALAEGGVVFDDVMGQMPTTAPSHYSLLTGLYPHAHGVYRNGQQMPEHLDTLGSVLGERGYATGAFVSGLPLIDELSGLARSFDAYDDQIENRRRNGQLTVDRALAWLEAQTGQPFFLFVHLFDAHGPYQPPQPLAEQFTSGDRGPWSERIPRYQRQIDPKTGGIITDLRYYIDHYDASIRHADNQLARLFDRLDLERTVVLVVTDHGESLDENVDAPLDHGSRLVQPEIRLAGVLRAPGVEPSRIKGLTGMVDFAPTVLGVMGHTGALPNTQGRDLSANLEDGTAGKRAEFATCGMTSTVETHAGYDVDESRLGVAVRKGELKLISYPTKDGGEVLFLHDLSADPDETSTERADPDDPQVAELLELMNRWNQQRREPFRGEEPADEFREKLESLGYVF